MASLQSLTVTLDVDASGVVRGLRSATGEVVRFDKAVSDAGSQGTRFSRAMDVALGMGLQQIALQAVQSIARIGAELATLGADLGETDSKFATVFGSATDAMVSMEQEWASVAGLTRGQFRGLAADVGAVVKGFGMTGQPLAEFSQRVLQVAGDLQSFHNVPIEETFAALRSGLTGESEPLKRFGIILTENEVKTRAVIEAQRLHVAASDQQALAAARLALITEKAGVAIGDLERTQDSTANKARRLAAELGNIRETLARSLAPAYGMVVDVLAQVMDGSQGLAGTLTATLGQAIFETVAQLLRFIEAGAGIVKSLAAVVGAVTGAGEVSWGFVELLAGLYADMKKIEAAGYALAAGVGVLRGAWASLTGDQAAHAAAVEDVNAAWGAAKQAMADGASGAARVDGAINRARQTMAEAGATIQQAAADLGDLTTATGSSADAAEKHTRKRRGEKDAVDEMRQSLAKLATEYRQLAEAGREQMGTLDLQSEVMRRRVDLLRAQSRLMILGGEALKTGGTTGQALRALASQLGAVERQARDAEARVKILLDGAANGITPLTPAMPDADKAAADWDTAFRRQIEGLNVPLSLQAKAQIARDAEELGLTANEAMAAAIVEPLPEFEPTIKFTAFEDFAAWLIKSREDIRQWGGVLNDVIGNVGGLFAAQHEARIAAIEAEEAREMERFDGQLRRIDEALAAENLSADERAALEIRQQLLTRDREAAEKKFAQEKATRNREAAERQKLITLAQIAIETAMNVVEVFPNPFLMAAAGVLGGIQAATVAATPIPRNTGGWVPGSGPDRDSVLMHLTPGEAVVTRRSAEVNAHLINAMNAFPGVRLEPAAAAIDARFGAGGPVQMSRADLDYLAGRIVSGVTEGVAGSVNRIKVVQSDRDVYDATGRHGAIVERNTVRFGGGA